MYDQYRVHLKQLVWLLVIIIYAMAGFCIVILVHSSVCLFVILGMDLCTN